MARTFNGSNEWFSATSLPPSFDTGGDPCTIAAWFNVSSTGTDYAIAGITQNGGVNHRHRLIYGGSSGSDTVGLESRTNSSATAFCTSSGAPSISSGAWHHGCAVFASNNSRTAYQDGAYAVTETTNKNVSSLTDTGIGGSEGASPPTNPFAGSICEVGFWRVALSAAEIAQLAAGYPCYMVRPDVLSWYFPMISGTTSSGGDEDDWMAAFEITDNNTVQLASSHAPISFRRQPPFFLASAAVGATVPPLAYYHHRRRRPA